MKTINASALIAEFYKMLTWIYVWGGARKGVVDCSGAFTYAFELLDSWMYHGSNTMWRKYTYDKGRYGEVPLLPGMACYKWRKAKDGSDDFHHVGLYIGFGLVIEAKGSKWGVIFSRIEDWTHVGKLRSKDGTILVYDVTGLNAETFSGIVTSSGGLHFRDGTSTLNGSLRTLPKGSQVSVLNVPVEAGWYAALFNKQLGFVMSEFIRLLEGSVPEVIDPQDSKPSTLRLGATGEDVLRAQTILVSKGYLQVAKERYDEGAVAAVKQFQAASQLSADGICGPLTWAALLSEPKTPPIPLYPKSMRVIASKAALNVRTGPGIKYEDIGDLPYGATVTVLKTEGSWAQIEWEGATAWCSAVYLAVV